MKEFKKKLAISKSNTVFSTAQINNIGLNQIPFRYEQHIYNRISICVTAASCIRHNVNAITVKMKSGKIAKDEFFYRTNSIYKALNMIDENLSSSIKGLSGAEKES